MMVTGLGSLGAAFRTDRMNNPIAAAVRAGSTNAFTRALDSSGIPWTYGDAFPGDPSMVTIKILGNPVEGARAILSQSSAIQDWYINHSGKSVLNQYGVYSGSQFSSLPTATQNAIIAGIYKGEGGSGQLMTMPSLPILQTQPPAAVVPDGVTVYAGDTGTGVDSTVGAYSGDGFGDSGSGDNTLLLALAILATGALVVGIS